jgi:hypothetical protein
MSIKTSIRLSGLQIIQAILLFALPMMGAYDATAQYMPKPNPAKANVRLANETRSVIQLKTLLANPKLVSAKASCEVTSFVVSFQPEGGEVYGPVRTEGALIKPAELDHLKAHGNYNIKIRIEHIHLNCNGKDVVEDPIIVTCFL